MTQPQFMTVSLNVLPSWASAVAGSLFSVEGRVSSAVENLPLAGTEIAVKGENQSVGANDQGSFIIHMSRIPAMLVFSCEGYIKQEILLTPPRFAPLLITMTNYRLTTENHQKT